MKRFFNCHVALALFATSALGETAHAQAPKVLHKTVKVGDLDIFYREAGSKDAPTVLLLHGFPTSSQMFRNLIPSLADKYHVIAPDYPGYGHSAMPAREQFKYTFDNLATVIDEFTVKLGLTKYAIYVQDYGAPVGYRLAVKHPERITAIIVRMATPTTKGWTTISGSPSRRTGTSRRAKRNAMPSASLRNMTPRNGSTPTA